MAASVKIVQSTGNPDIDGILSGFAWNTANLTYSFPDSKSDYEPNYFDQPAINHLKPLTGAQQDAIGSVITELESFTVLHFTEVSGGGGDIRYALSSVADPAYAYYPSNAPVGGDAFFNSRGTDFDNLKPGSYGFMTFLHETGHTLGLKHGHVRENGFPALPRNRDSIEFSVMTYRAYIGGPVAGGFANEKFGFPQSYMMFDIAALQDLYGANYNFNSGNTTYSWNPNTGQEFIDGVAQTAPGANRVFLTVWDGGGTDTYDFSNYRTALVIRLTPGSWSVLEKKQLAQLDVPTHHFAHGNVYNALLFDNNPTSLIENANGGSGSDRISGNSADNTLTGNGGADTLRGGDGNDHLVGDGGHDVMVGGAGADTFVFVNLHDSVVGARRDVISDFQSAQGDKIDLTGLEHQAGESFHFIGNQPFDKSHGEIRDHHGIVAVDVNGDGKADFQIKVAGALHDTDFIL